LRPAPPTLRPGRYKVKRPPIRRAGWYGWLEVSDKRTAKPGDTSPVDGANGGLLDLIAEVACAMFQARAASVILHDASTSELVVAAAAGQAGTGLAGMHIPMGVGIAGRVFAGGEPVAVDDVADDENFAREIAAATGYVPTGLMAAPLTHADRAIGVLEVLDRPQFSRFSLAELDLLALYARVSAAAIARTCADDA
jgi:GAF domain-containing protein